MSADFVKFPTEENKGVRSCVCSRKQRLLTPLISLISSFANNDS